MRRTFAYLAVLILTLSGLSFAQATIGTPRFGTYGGGPDVINLANLNMRLTVPIIHKPGRGLPLNYSLTYDTSIWYQASVNGVPTWQPITEWGWRKQTDVAVGSAPYTITVASYRDYETGQRIYYNRYWYKTYIDRQGVGHGFGLMVSDDANSGFPESRTGTSYDGLVSMYVASGPYAEVTPQVGGKIVPVLVNLNSPGTYRDANGNKITSSNNVFTDTLGQTALSITGTAPTVTYSYKDTSGAQRNIVVTYQLKTVQTHFQCSGVSEYGPSSQYLVTSITYPNSTSYQFTYEPTPGYPGSVTGRVASVTLPTGGVINYTYTGGSNGIRCENSTIAGLTRVVAGGTWTYTRTLLDTLNSTTTATDPDGNQNVITFHDIYSTQNQSYANTGALVSTETRCYYSAGVTGCDPNVSQPITRLDVTNKLANNQTNETDTYFNSSGLTTQVDEYDFGSNAKGALLRSTTTTYAVLANGITGLPSVVTVHDGSGGTAAQTTYSYDEYAVTTTSGLPQKDAVTGARGNPTSITRLLSGGTNPVSHIHYDDAGNALTVTDPGGHTTTFGYDYTNLKGGFITQVTRPVTGSVSHVSSANYDINTGLKTSDTDENGQVTTYAYDSMLRPTVTTFPDGGETDISYNDGARTVTSTQKLTSTQSKAVTVLFDAYGRPIQNQLADPLGTDYVDISYDSIGRVHAVTNPYRSTSDPTYGSTIYDYDALGRVVLTSHAPEFTGVNQIYSGNCVTTNDEVNNKRKSCTDGLGRLTQVFEDPTGLNYETDYQYDALDNLTRVDQKGGDPNSANWRARLFTYDSLGRLISSNTPESGTTSYSYDLDGNVISKVSPKPNQTDPAVTETVTYSYDALHRLIQKTYSNGDPTITYAYDQAAPWGWPLQYQIGRLTNTSVSDASGLIAANLYNFDRMGRIIHIGSCTVANCSGASYNVDAVYDLAGNLTSLSYPSGRQVTYAYDNASRLNNVTFANFQSTAVNYSYWTVPATVGTAAGFWPTGTPRWESLGNSTQSDTELDNRLRISSKLLNAASGTLSNRSYSYFPNGSVNTISDLLNSNKSQTFTYDQLNRITTAVEGPPAYLDGFGQSVSLDAWGNVSSISATKGNPVTYGGAANGKNQVVGWCYDAAGNLLRTDVCGANQYSYDAENRMNWAAGRTNTFDALGRRVRKYNNYDPNDWTDYVYFGANVVAERAANGDWSDYIFAGGKRVAKADTFTYDLLFYGTNCSNCGSQYSAFDLPSLGDLSGYVIRTGDKLKFAQYQDANARGGMVLFFSDGSNTAWTLRDSDGELVNTDHRTLDWHFRSADLSAYAGKTLSGIRYTSDYENLAGDWILIFADVTLLGGDGAVHSIYNGQRSASLNVSGSAGSTRGYYIRHLSNVATYYPMTTTFYDGDHLGSTTETTRYGGWPTWAATYLPYGAEYNAVGGDNHYKFTGMERDAESGLDHAWFRQYNAQVARWYSPDPLGGSIGDPQSLNRFAYVLNDPGNLIDPLGLFGCLGGKSDACAHLFGFGYRYDALSLLGDSVSWQYVQSTGYNPITGEVEFQTGTLTDLHNLSFVQFSSFSSGPHGSTGNAASSGTRNPRICGGTFEFAGMEADLAEGGAFTGVFHEHDSIEGNLVGNLTEGWAGGEVVAAGGGKITTTGDKSVFQGFLGFVGASLSAGPLAGIQAGYAGGYGWGGLYVEGHLGHVAWGGGGYLRTSCKAGG